MSLAVGFAVTKPPGLVHLRVSISLPALLTPPPPLPVDQHVVLNYSSTMPTYHDPCIDDNGLSY